LTFRQATALAGRLYRAWADGEGRERTISVEYDNATGKMELVDGSEDDVPEYWEAAVSRLNELDADDREALERTFGPIIDHQLLREGIRRVDSPSRLLLLKAFTSALRDAFESRQRNARGDYSPDLKAARFPNFEKPTGREPEVASLAMLGKRSLKGLVEDWWSEAEVAGRTVSTHESYRNTMGRLVAFLGHDDASRLKPEDVIAFKDHRLAQGVSTKTVADSDIAGLKSVLSWAVSNRRMASNPAEGVKLKAKRPIRTREKGFTEEEAKTILLHASGYKRTVREGAKAAAAKRWVPWLCAYTGARVGEMVQLRKEDIKRERDWWIVNITPEAGTVKDKESRAVVLHAHLLELGFLDFVKQSADGYLFIPVAQGSSMRGVWKGVKNRLREFVREVITDVRVAPNHGWRHTFKTVGREAGIEDSILDSICGHAPGSVGGSYGTVSITAQARAFERFPRFQIGEQVP
jgi:integrase